MADTSSAYKVEGLRELVSALRRIDSEYPKEVTKINKKAAEPVAQRAKQIVRVLTGRLSSSIRALASQRAATVAAGRKGIPYAGVQHYGWPRHNIEPNYYLTKALDDRADEVVGIYTDELIAFIESKFH